MLPQLGELLARGNPQAAAPFMSACIIVTQVVITLSAAWIGRRAAKGRKPLLLVGYGVLPVRGVLYTLTHATGALIAIQILDGVANAIFVVVSILVIAVLAFALPWLAVPETFDPPLRKETSPPTEFAALR
jgi:hypothetical protein